MPRHILNIKKIESKDFVVVYFQTINKLVLIIKYLYSVFDTKFEYLLKL